MHTSSRHGFHLAAATVSGCGLSVAPFTLVGKSGGQAAVRVSRGVES